MSIFNKAREKVSGAFKDIEKKANDSAAEKKLTTQIKSAQDEITNLFHTIGEVYYNATKGDSDESLKDLCLGVDSLIDKIAELNVELDAVRSIFRCAACGAEISQQVRFCPSCGAPQPEKQQFAPVEFMPKPVEIEKCPECGRERKPGMRFCEGCGHNFAPTAGVGFGGVEEPFQRDE